MKRIIASVLLAGAMGGSSRALTHTQVNQRSHAITVLAALGGAGAYEYFNRTADVRNWTKLGVWGGAAGVAAFMASHFVFDKLTPENRFPRAVKRLEYISRELDRAQINSRSLSAQELIDCAKAYQGATKWKLVEMVDDFTRWNAMLGRTISAFEKAAADKSNDQAFANQCAFNKQKAISKREIVQHAKKTLEDSKAYHDELEAYRAAKEVERLNGEYGFTYNLK